MSYTKTAWVDGTTPAISAANLGNLEQGVLDAHLMQVADYVIYKTPGASTFEAKGRVLAAVAANADAGAVLQSALDNINSSTTPRGLIAFAADTTFTVSTTASIRRTYASGGSDDHGWIRIVGSGGTVISLSGTKEFVNLNKVADYDGFCGIEVGNFTINQNSPTVTDSYSFVLSPGPHAWLTRGDIKRVWIHDIVGYNVTTPATGNGNTNGALWLGVQQATTDVTQSNITDILVERLNLSGGNFAVVIVGGVTVGSTPGLKIFGDKIVVQDVAWDSGVAPGSLQASSGVQVGSGMFGDRALVQRCTLKNSGDDIIEVNNLKNIIVRDCLTQATTNSSFVAGNFNYVNGVDNTTAEDQTILFENCIHVRGFGLSTNSDTAFGLAVGATGVVGGTVIYRNCKSYCGQAISSAQAIAGAVFHDSPGNVTTWDKVIFENHEIDELYNFNAGSALTPFWMYRMPKVLVIRNMKITTRGAQTSGAYLIRPLFLNGQGSPTRVLDIDGLIWNDVTTGRTAADSQIITLGENTAAGTNDIGGTIRGARIIATSDTNPTVIVIGDSTHLTLRKLLIEDCDLSRVSGGKLLAFDTVGQNEAPVFVRNFKGNATSTPADPPAEIAFTPGATTVAAQYLGHYEGLMTVTGGTVTVVSVSTDNVTFRQVAAGTNVSFYIDHGMYVKLTYSVAPTCVVIPRR